MKTETRLLSIDGVAKILGLKSRSVRNLCLKFIRGESGGLKAMKLGKAWRVKASDLEEFIEAGYAKAKRR
ncbi:MAG: helix-turn-helix domain-containing protein [Syntrophorhabdales bacterium]|jgi:excisionase family DNA binding protein